MSATLGKNEEILLRVDNVRCRKNGDGGVLYVLPARIFWVDEKSDSASISHGYDEIRVQKVSPDGKSKVQLQVCLNNGDTTTFQFIDGGGAQKQLQDREAVKELLQQLLPRFRNRLNQDMEQKQKILQENKELFRLYKELVATSVISAEEFWQTYAAEKVNAKSGNGSTQKVGVSTGFLSDVAKADGCNGMKFNLTADIMEGIFRTYPAVRKKHLETVPHELSEKEFWTQFFRSHYFYRDRTITDTTPKDIFAPCIKMDDDDLESEVKATVEKSRGGLSAYTEDTGLADNNDQDPDDRKKIRNPANAALMKRFNYHSNRILHACLGDDAPSTSGAQSSSLGSLLPTTSRDYESNAAPPPKIRIIECEELLQDTATDGLSLNIQQEQQYQVGIGDKDKEAGNVAFQQKDAIRWCNILVRAIDNRNKRKGFQVPVTKVTLDSLMLLNNSTDEKKPPNDLNLDDIRSMYVAANELLRHFWCCFPTTTVELEQKVVKMHDTLQKFEEAKLKPFLEACRRNKLYRPGSNPAEHISKMLRTAYSKFQTWHEKRV